MAFPPPSPGLVIRYNYLWYSEFRAGRDEGQKDRPCAIIAAIRVDGAKNARVLVLPITHTPPHDANFAVELPKGTKQRLGLDDERSWVVLSEWNEFAWPGPDLRPAVPGDSASVVYGILPPRLFSVIREQFLQLVGTGAAAAVSRTE